MIVDDAKANMSAFISCAYVLLPFFFSSTTPLGLPPLIPPNASLMCDIEIISFRPRPKWVKPVIQEPGLSQRLFWSRPEDESDYEGHIRSLKASMASYQTSLPNINNAATAAINSSGSKGGRHEVRVHMYM